ncbi:MAG: permease-like cell division protein FtsX [Bacilli bacterium]|nr:permease-like cell division protein FtsX [Bacilli bacterium]
MKTFRILGRNIRDSFRGVWRNLSLSLASISCITITLIVVSIAMILSANVNNFTSQIEKDVTIVVFLDQNIEEDDIDSLYYDIDTIQYVESITFKGKDEIAGEMMEASETYDSIMSNWTHEDNPLQDTYLVKVTDIDHIAEVAKEIGYLENVSVVKYGEGMVEELVSIFDMIKNVTIVIVIALILVTAFLIANTIKITIDSRRREIEIMRLVGASNINIKIPFIFEGLVLGVIGSIIPIIITCYGYAALYTRLHGQLFSSIIKLIVPEPFMYNVSLLLLVIGMVVGMVGSLRAVKKYLKI